MAYVSAEIILFLYQLIKKNTKVIGMIGLLILGYLAGSANPVTTTDYGMYYQQYIISGLTGNFYFERGYSLLGTFFYHLGFNYAQFRFFFSMLIILVLYIGICRFTSNIALFVSIYGITCFFNDATQIRNFMMISLVIIGVSFLKEINLKNIVLATLFILLGAQFQSSGYYFLLILLIRLFPKGKILSNFKIVLIFEVVFSGIIIVLGKGRIIKLLTILAAPFSNGRENLVSKISTQYVYGISGRKMILITVSVIMTLYLSKIMANNLKNNKNAQVLYTAIVSGMLSFPLIFIAIDYSRILRNTFLFFILLICIFYSNKKVQIEKNKKMILNLGILCTCLLTAFTNYYLWGPLFQQSIPYLAQMKKF